MTRTKPAAAEFDALFLAHYAPLARLLFRVCGDTATAEELAAEAFWKYHKAPPATRDNVPGWLYRTGLRLALDHLKKRKRRERYEGHAPPPAPLSDPQQALERVEIASRVRAVLAALRPVQASLLLLRAEGHRLAEIAEILSLNPNSVGTLLARADQAFRKEYVNRHGEH